MERLIPFRIGKFWGFCNDLKKMITPPEFTNATSFRNGFAIVTKEKRKGILNQSPKLVVNCSYPALFLFKDGLARFQNDDGLYGYLNQEGEEIIPARFKEADDFQEGLAPVSKELIFGPWAFIDSKGNFQIDFEFEKALHFQEGLAAVKRGKFWGYIDKQGKTIIPFEYELACSFSEGLARVKKENRWGYIDAYGNKVLPFVYNWASDYKDGMACVDKNAKVGYIGRNGQTIIECKYDIAAPFFSEGFAFAKRGNHWGFIDK